MQHLRTLVGRFLPSPVRAAVRRVRMKRVHARNARRSAGEVFAEIYREKMWVQPGDGERFSSGSGSFGPVAEAYKELVVGLIKEHALGSVVDVGCGDFRIGREIAKHVDTYTGVDVVPDLIQYHQENNSGPGVTFLCKDAATEALPEAELCLVRQVLQHLSNKQIAGVLENARRYRYVLVTEHYPVQSHVFVPNKDKVHGADIRAYVNSAVVLEAPPFNWPEGKLVLSMPASDAGEIRTYLYERVAAQP